MSNRILVFYGSYRSDRMGIRLADVVVERLRRRGDDAELIDAKAIGAMYTDDALFLPPSHDVLRGPAAVEKFFTGLFAAGVTGHKLELKRSHPDCP